MKPRVALGEAIGAFEAHSCTDIESHHVGVGLGMFEELDSLDDTFIQGVELLDADLIDVDHADSVIRTLDWVADLIDLFVISDSLNKEITQPQSPKSTGAVYRTFTLKTIQTPRN